MCALQSTLYTTAHTSKPRVSIAQAQTPYFHQIVRSRVAHHLSVKSENKQAVPTRIILQRPVMVFSDITEFGNNF